LLWSGFFGGGGFVPVFWFAGWIWAVAGFGGVVAFVDGAGFGGCGVGVTVGVGLTAGAGFGGVVTAGVGFTVGAGFGGTGVGFGG
jgi:hypothetical protein